MTSPWIQEWGSLPPPRAAPRPPARAQVTPRPDAPCRECLLRRRLTCMARHPPRQKYDPLVTTARPRVKRHSYARTESVRNTQGRLTTKKRKVSQKLF